MSTPNQPDPQSNPTPRPTPPPNPKIQAVGFALQLAELVGTYPKTTPPTAASIVADAQIIADFWKAT